MKVQHDIHTHTRLSLCAQPSATLDYYIRSAKKLGLNTVGLSDHLWDSAIPFPAGMHHASYGEGGCDWYRAQDLSHIRELLPELNAADREGIRFFFGAEVEYCQGRGAAITMEHAETLDYLIVPNSHTHLAMDRALYEPYQKHADFMLRAAMDIAAAPTAQFVTTLVHPFDPVACPYRRDYVWDCLRDSQLTEAFQALAESGIAAEINTACFTKCPDDALPNHGLMRILAVAKACGCKFTFGSDSHAEGEEDTILRAGKIADILGLTENDLADFVK